MGAGCQRNRLVMGVVRGEEVCRKGCPYIRQLANSVFIPWSVMSVLQVHLQILLTQNYSIQFVKMSVKYWS